MIDLYAGAGGFSLGFTRFNLLQKTIRFAPVWANDNNPDAVATYNANFGNHCTCGDIEQVLANGKFVTPRADIVIGGPPCQGFSLLNKNRSNDPRKYLWLPFMEVVARSGASVFVMENVPELLGSDEYSDILANAFRMGFRLQKAKLVAADYGAPQIRTRAFIMGSRLADPTIDFPPLRTHYNPVSKKELDFRDYIADPDPWLSVRSAIGDLPVPVGTEITDLEPPLNLHFGRRPTALSLERYRTIADEGMNRFDLQRLAPELTPACWLRKTTSQFVLGCLSHQYYGCGCFKLLATHTCY